MAAADDDKTWVRKEPESPDTVAVGASPPGVGAGAGMNAPGVWTNVPERLGRFPVRSFIGRGGLGEVYLADHPDFDMPVAIKTLVASVAFDPEGIERFKREGRLAARIQHQNIINVFECGYDEARHVPFLVMEYVEGKDLEQMMEDEGGALPFDRALRIIAAACEGLAVLAKRGIVHRDIKPGNIMLTDEGTVKLADFGLAKNPEEDLTLTTTHEMVGTPYYMAPEQIASSKDADTRADIHALGATFYHLCTGSVPYDAPTAYEVLRKIVQDPFPPPRKMNKSLSLAADEIICKMMAKNPADRYQTIDELQEALAELEHPEQAEGKRKAAAVRPRTAAAGQSEPGQWLQFVPAIVCALLVLVLAIGMGVLGSRLGLQKLPWGARLGGWLVFVGVLPWVTAFATDWALGQKSNLASVLLLVVYVILGVVLAFALLGSQLAGGRDVLTLAGAFLASAGYTFWACEQVAAWRGA